MIFALAFSLLDSSTVWQSNCANEPALHKIDVGGILRNTITNEMIVGNQCMPELLDFLTPYSDSICKESGVNIAVVRSRWGQSFFHFLFNELQRLFFLVTSPGVDISEYKVVGSGWAYSDSQFNEWLSLFNMENKWINEVPADVNEVIVAPGVDSCASVSPKFVNYMRDLAASKYGPCESVEPRIVWMRRDYHTRYVSHTEMGKILSFINKHLSKILDFPSNVTVDIHDPSVALHHTRDILQCSSPLLLIGPHGAALSNMVFALENSYVLELHPEVYVENQLPFQSCFADVALASGLYFASVVARSSKDAFQGGEMTFTEPTIVAALHALNFQVKIKNT